MCVCVYVSLARFRVSGCVTKQLDLCSVLCETVNDSERETDMRKIINTTLNYESREREGLWRKDC